MQTERMCHNQGRHQLLRCSDAPRRPLALILSHARYPLFLEGKLFTGTFHFHDTHTLVQHELQEVETLVLPPAIVTAQL